MVNESLYVWNGNAWENVGNIKGDIGATSETGAKGYTGAKGDTGDKGVKGDAGDTGPATDENAGWKLPVDEILTTSTLPTGVKKGYRVAICTSSLLAIKEYNGISWETESLDAYSVIPLNILEVYKCIWQKVVVQYIWAWTMGSWVNLDS